MIQFAQQTIGPSDATSHTTSADLNAMAAPDAEFAAVSVIMPAFNEEAAIGDQIEQVEMTLRHCGVAYEIIVVDDGSTDRTAERAGRHDVRIVRLPENRGYGAALKAGVAVAEHECIVIIDADGTYPAEAIPELLRRAADYDMVVGARTGRSVHIPLVRRPAKWLLSRLASYLAQRRIPDLNSGLRVIRKSIVREFEHLLPAGFSFTTTITLAHLCNDYRVYYQPIDYHKRIGTSKIRMSHPYQFLVQILRIMVYFNPLRVFLPLGATLFLLGVGKLAFDMVTFNISDGSTMAILAAVIVWAIGLLADQNARIGRCHARQREPKTDESKSVAVRSANQRLVRGANNDFPTVY
jgi:glycosyltransferase involved in cell wall biosynthesis